MATTIKTKSSSVSGKKPDPSSIERAELALNLADKKLYSKDASDAIFEIGAEGVTDLGIANRDAVKLDVTSDTGTDATIPAATISLAGLMTADDKTKLEAAAALSVNDAVLTISQGATSLGTFSANQAVDASISIPEALAAGDNVSELANDAGYITAAAVKDGKITIVDADGGAVGEFTVNQAGDTEITLPEIPETTGFVKLDDDGTEQSIVGGGGLDVAGGIKSEFGTNAAQLGNVAPLNDWSCYPARPITFYAPLAPPPTPEPEVPTFSGGLIGSGGVSSAGSVDVIDLGDA